MSLSCKSPETHVLMYRYLAGKNKNLNMSQRCERMVAMRREIGRCIDAKGITLEHERACRRKKWIHLLLMANDLKLQNMACHWIVSRMRAMWKDTLTGKNWVQFLWTRALEEMVMAANPSKAKRTQEMEDRFIRCVIDAEPKGTLQGSTETDSDEESSDDDQPFQDKETLVPWNVFRKRLFLQVKDAKKPKDDTSSKRQPSEAESTRTVLAQQRLDTMSKDLMKNYVSVSPDDTVRKRMMKQLEAYHTALKMAVGEWKRADIENIPKEFEYVNAMYLDELSRNTQVTDRLVDLFVS